MCNNGRRITKFVILVAALFSAFFVFFSCSNLFDDIKAPLTDGKTVTITGCVGDSQGGNSRAGRMALPSGDFAETDYVVWATAPGVTDPVYGDIPENSNTFTIALSLGKVWTITIEMQAKETEDSDFMPVLSGSYTYDHALTVADVTVPISIVLVPISGVNGIINLPVSVASGVSAETVVISGLSDSPETYTLSDGTYTINKLGVPSGVYTVTIDFKNADGLVIYSTTQTINVISNMTTRRWVSNGSSSPINGDGTFVVTESLVQAFAPSQIYVGANPYQIHQPLDTNLGTPYEPLATVGEAIRRLTDSSKDYTIHVFGEQKGSFTLGDTPNNFAAHSVTLCGMTGNTTDILDGDGTGDGTVLTITTTAPVTIRNLKITGGYNTSENSAGINMEAGSKLVLENGALITGNTGYMRGAGIYATGENTEIVMNSGSKISGNELTYTGENSYTYNFGGAGVYISCSEITDTSKLPKLTINTGAEISGNTAKAFCRGGGIYAENAIVSINGGKITGNKSGDCAGNIYVVGDKSSITMTAGEISNGDADSRINDGGRSAYGGGVVMYGGTFEMSGGKICNNKVYPDDVGYGSGIGEGSGAGITMGGATFIMTGGEISGNSIVSDGEVIKGGAIKFEDSNAVFKIGGSAYIPYGVNGVTGAGKNDIYVGANKKITILSALTGTAPVATIVPASPSEGLTVLEKDTNASAADFAAACRKIAVAPNGSTSYILGTNGILKQGVVTTPANAASVIESMSGSGTVALNGTISSGNWSVINESLQTLADEHPDVKVAIDLSGVTNLTTLPVTSFMGCTNLESVTLPDTLTSIANGSCTWDSANSVYNYTGAFYGCTSLTSVELPDGLTTIGTSAFCGCENLESINLPSGLTTIGKNAFEGCSSLSSVDIPDTVTRINDMAFKGCSSITEVELPDTMTYIGQHAFMNCTNLAEVNIPSGVTTLYQSAFANTAITSIEIPNTVQTLGGCVFFGTNLTSVTIPSSVTSIGTQCFNDCKDLESVTFENGCSITSLSDGVFGGCSKLTSIEIPSTVTSIADSAFSGCTVLSNITIPNSVTSIGERAFLECKAITEIEIPSGITEIKSLCFYNCNNLVVITIPSTVTSIGNNAFSGCSKLATVNYLGTEAQRATLMSNVGTGNDSLINATWNYASFTGTAYTQLPAGTTDGSAGTSGTYVLFGDWPTSIKEADVTVYETTAFTVGDFSYSLGSDGAWYCKIVEDAYFGSNTTYSNGTKAHSKGDNVESWFKVEPIKWRVVSNNFDGGKKLLVAENVFSSCQFYDSYESRGDVKSNNYKESRIRAYLNGYEYNQKGTTSSEFVGKGFINTAFMSSLQGIIETTTVKNGTESGAASGFECEDTEDKLFLLSKAELQDTTLFSSGVYSKIYCTDFALANSISQATSTQTAGETWIRTPSGDDCTYRPSGSTFYQSSITNDSMGIVPALCLNN